MLPRHILGWLCSKRRGAGWKKKSKKGMDDVAVMVVVERAGGKIKSASLPANKTKSERLWGPGRQLAADRQSTSDQSMPTRTGACVLGLVRQELSPHLRKRQSDLTHFCGF